MTEHQLFLFLAEVVVLFLAARIGGEIAARLRIPLVVGELVMGILLGPSLLGWLWPDGFEALFPSAPSQRNLLEVVSWLGIVLLVLLAGMETRLGVLRQARGAVVGGWIGGFGVPLAAGFALGMAAPGELIPAGIDPIVFSVFLATALSISAIPVIARILLDLDVYGTRVGAIIIASAVGHDTVGWIVLAIVTGLVSGGLEAASIARTTLLTAAFIVAAFTLGRPLVRAAMRISRNSLRAPFAQVSMMLFLALAFGAVTQAIGVHLVLGAFVAGVLVGKVRRTDPEARRSLQQVSMGFFVPFFFAYTGIKVDLAALGDGGLAFAAVAVVVACLAKVVGGGVGTWLGGLPPWEAAAVGFGLNARGAMELVIAAIGLSIGVLNATSYATIVLIAVVTTLMAAPSLEFCINRAGPEARRKTSGARAPAESPA